MDMRFYWTRDRLKQGANFAYIGHQVRTTWHTTLLNITQEQTINKKDHTMYTLESFLLDSSKFPCPLTCEGVLIHPKGEIRIPS